jgi:hypothetical protein
MKTVFITLYWTLILKLNTDNLDKVNTEVHCVTLLNCTSEEGVR